MLRPQAWWRVIWMLMLDHSSAALRVERNWRSAYRLV
jgi:hypothetical protein